LEIVSAMADPATIAEIMNQMWAKFLPDIAERVEVLEKAAEAISRGALTDELRKEASSAAHKLAGTLGTFGLDEGSVLAREAESFYEGKSSTGMLEGRPGLIAAQLRAMLAARSR
jgi:HPt (histidine-containing phosphotransfer) domain-containing protein